MNTITNPKCPILTSLLEHDKLQSVQNYDHNSDLPINTEPTKSSGNQKHVLSILDSIDPSKTEAIIVYDSDTDNETDKSYQLFVDLDSQDASLPAVYDAVDKIVEETPTTIQEKIIDEISWANTVDSLISTLSSTVVSVKSSSSSTNVNSVEIVKRANNLQCKISRQKMQKNIDPKLVMKTLIQLIKLDHQPIWKKIHNGTVALGKSTYHNKRMIRKLSKIELMRNMIRDSKHWTVVLERLPTYVLERFAGGGYARRAGPVRLPDIEQVRRENGRMLTAQVKPLATAAHAAGMLPPPALSFVTRQKGLCGGASVLTLVPAAGARAAGPPAASEPNSQTSIRSRADEDVQTLSGNQGAATDANTRVEAHTDGAIELSDNDESLTAQESNASPAVEADDSQTDAPAVRSDFNTSYKHFVQHIDENRALREIATKKRTIEKVEAEAALKQIEKLKRMRRPQSNHEPVSIHKVKTVPFAIKNYVHPKPVQFNTIVTIAKDDISLAAASQVQKPNMRIEMQSLSKDAPSQQNNSENVAPGSDIVDLTDNEGAEDLEDTLEVAVIPTVVRARHPPNTIAPCPLRTITKIVPTPPPVQTYLAPQNDSSHDQNRSFVGHIVNRNGVPVVMNNKTQIINHNIQGNVPTVNNIIIPNNTPMEVQNPPPLMFIPSSQNNNIVLQSYPPQNIGQPMVQFHQNILVNQSLDNSLQQNVGHQNVIFAQPNYVPLRPNVVRTEHNMFPQVIIESDMLNPPPTENIEVRAHQTFNSDVLNLPAGSYLILSPNLDQPNTINVLRHNAVANGIPMVPMEQQNATVTPMELMPQITNVRSLAANEQFVANDHSQMATVDDQMLICEKEAEPMDTDANEGVEAASFVPGPANPLELYASTPKNARDVLASAPALVLARVPRRCGLWTLDTGYLVFTDSVLSLGDWSMFALTPRSVCELIRGEHELPPDVVLKCRPMCTNNAKRYVLVVSDDINPKTDSSGGPAAPSPAAPSQDMPRIKVKAFASFDNFNNRNKDSDVRNRRNINTYSIKDEERVNDLYSHKTNNSNSLKCEDKNSLNSNKVGNVGGTDGIIRNNDANMVINVNTDVNNGDTDKVNTLNTDVLGTVSTDSVNKEIKDAVGTGETDTVVTSDSSSSSKMDCEDSKTNCYTKNKNSDNLERDSSTMHCNCKIIYAHDNLECVNKNNDTAYNTSVSCNCVKLVNSEKKENENNSYVLDKNQVTITEVKNNTITDLNIDVNKLNSSSMDVDSKTQCSNNLNLNCNTDHCYSKQPEVVNISIDKKTNNIDNASLDKENGSNKECNSTQTINTVIIDVDNKLEVNNSNMISNNVDSPTVEVSSEVKPSKPPSVKVNSDKKTLRKRHDSNYLVVSDRKRNYFRLSRQQNVYARMLSCVSSASLGFKHAMRGFALLLYSAEDGRLFPVRACRRSRRVLCCLRHTKRGCRLCKSGDWRHLRTLQLVANSFNQLDSQSPEWRCVF